MDQLLIQQLNTKRLVLRGLRVADWKEISFLRSDPEVNKLVKRTPARNKKEALKFIKKINDNYGKNGFYYWCITLLDSDLTIGTICLWNFSNNGTITEIGYDLHPTHYQKGIMDEALKCVIKFAFEQLNIELIEAFTHLENRNSRKLLHRNNFIFMENRVDEDNMHNCIYELRST